MSPEAQRIAIAEACPKVIHQINGDDFYVPSFGSCTSRRCCENSVLSDINAMHAAEAWLLANFTPYGNWNVASWWENNLLVVCNGGVPLTAGYYSHRACHATAAQRAEAFLRTIGKWKESA